MPGKSLFILICALILILGTTGSLEQNDSPFSHSDCNTNHSIDVLTITPFAVSWNLTNPIQDQDPSISGEDDSNKTSQIVGKDGLVDQQEINQTLQAQGLIQDIQNQTPSDLLGQDDSLRNQKSESVAPQEDHNSIIIQKGGKEKAQSSEDEIIIRFKTEPGKTMNAEVANKVHKDASTKAKKDSKVKDDFKVKKDFNEKGLSGTQVVKVPAGLSVEEALALYAENPDVLSVEPNYRIELMGVPDDPGFSFQWGLLNAGNPGADIRAVSAWNISTGSSGVLIAIPDTGVDISHPDLAGNIWSKSKEVPGNGIDDDANGYIDDVNGWDFVNDDSSPADDNGHGTHVAGIAGAVGNNGIGISGVMWDTKILPLKVIGASGYGYESDAIEAVLYAQQAGAQVISISWGSYGESLALKDALAGYPGLVVCAAGNNGQDNDQYPLYPASYPLGNIISVTATDDQDRLASFGNYGIGSVDIAAPGVGIYSTVPGSGYDTRSGTSMSAPFVAGVAGLVLSENGDLDGVQLAEILISSADRLGSLEGKISSSGRVNAEMAFSLASGEINVTPTPTPMVTPTPTLTPEVPGDGFQAAPLNPEFVSYIRIQSTNVSETTEEGHGLGYIPSPLDRAFIQGQVLQISDVELLDIPSSYDLRNYGRVTSVRDQGDCGSCWAFATYGSTESVLKPGETWDFSENNLKNTHGFDPGPCDGGNYEMSTAYLTRWSGPVTEAADPYVDYPITSPAGLVPVKHVQNVLFIPNRINEFDNNKIKTAIMGYGGVGTMFYWNGGYYSYSTKTYYYSGTLSSNHAVTIIGWDDNKVVPGAPGNGAFLCKNSWWTDWGDSGYFWISYYDSKLGRDSNTVFLSEPASNYDHIYQYDPLGWVIHVGYPPDTNAWGANVFTSARNEELRAVGFYAVTPNTAYEVYIYKNPNTGPINSGGPVSSKTGIIPIPEYAGYRTIPLDMPVTLNAGDTYSIVVKLTSPTTSYPLAIELPATFSDGSCYSCSAEASPGQSYVRRTGYSWVDLTSYSGYSEANVCIKGYTKAWTPPVANFTATPATAITPARIQFNDTSTNSPTSWQWKFGDGNTSSERNPVHTYEEVGTYDVNLTVENAYGSDSVTKTDYITVVEAPDFLNGWNYRKLVTIAGSSDGVLTDYQMRFVVHRSEGTDSGEHVYLGTNVKEDYSDLRFTTIGNAPMAYWIESSDAGSAVVWVKVPEIPVTGTQVYLYYGNPGAEAVSDGDATFPFFDDFAGSSVDTGKWDTSLASVSGGVCTISTSTTTTAYIQSKQSFPIGYAARFRWKTPSERNWIAHGFYASTANRAQLYYNNARQYLTVNAGSSTTTGHSNSYASYAVWEVQRESASLVKYGYNDGVLTQVSTNVPLVDMPVAFRVARSSGTTSSSIDWVCVRKTTANMPVIAAWGAREESPCPPSAEFSANKTRGALPLTVQFTDLSYPVPKSWHWDFGDGYTSSEQNPLHVYEGVGTYDVNLTVYNDHGSDTLIKTGYIQVSESQPFLSGWMYRKLVTIAGSSDGVLTDYQMRFTVHRSEGVDIGEHVYVGTNVKEDYSDLRFTTITNEVLSYWIESSDAGSAVVWVKVPEIPVTGTQVYLYYGNPGAEAVSDGDATFPFFDDFAGSSVDTGKWDTSLASVSGGVCTISTSTTTTAYIQSKQSFPIGYAARFRWKTPSERNWIAHGFYASTANRAQLYYNNARQYLTVNAGSSTTTGHSNSYASYAVWEVQRESASLVKYGYNDGVLTQVSTNVPLVDMPVAFRVARSSGTTSSSIDWVCVRKTTANMPVIAAWGAREESPCPPSAEFSANKTRGALPLTVQFTDLSYPVPKSWHWDFGDGYTSSEQNPLHVYEGVGTYDVNLTVYNDHGSDTLIKTGYIQVSESQPFLSGWMYRKLVTIAGSSDGVLTDYQMRFTVHRSEGVDIGEHVYVGTNVKEDYSDLRFTVTDNTLLSYWIESSDAGSAVVWVKVPEIPVTGTQVYLYYGNPGAEAVSDGDATFPFFDDFAGSSVDTGKWDTSLASVSGGVCTISTSTTTTAYIQSKQSFPIGYAARFRWKTPSERNWIAHGFYASTANRAQLYYNNARQYLTVNAGSSTTTGHSNSYASYAVWEVQRESASLVKYGYNDGVLTQVSTNVPLVDMPVAFRVARSSGTTSSSIDWVCVRKTTANVPVIAAWGNVEA